MTGYLDVGNSDIKCATASPWVEVARFATRDCSFESLDKALPKSLTSLIVASVVPSLNPVLEAFAKKRQIPLTFITADQPVVRIATDDPSEVGADLIAAAAAVVGDCLVVDAGTATTLSLIEDSTLKGVAIAPGPKTQLTSLVSNTALLEDAVLQPTKQQFGVTTASALGSGIVQAQVAWIEQIARLYPYHTVIVTGGYATLLSDSMNIEHVVDPFVVFKGLQVIEYGNA